MKILFIADQIYPELGCSYKAITEKYKAMSNKYTNCKFRLAINYNGKNYNKLDLLFLIKNFDIIHYYGGWSFFHIKVLLLSFILKKKTIITPMGIYEDWSLNQKKLKKYMALIFYQSFILNKTDTIHCASSIEKKNLQKITKNKNLQIIPHGIDPLGSYEANKKFFLGTKKKALFFSRLHDKKGIIELVEAWKNIENTEWELHIYGPDYDNVTKKIEKISNSNKSIKIFDAVFDDKKKIYEEYDLFILPSKSENFGYVILEALQFGLPVLTTSNTPWSIIEKKDAGWIIDSNLTQLESKIQEILSLTKYEFEKRSINAVELSKEYVWSNLEEQHFAMYEKLY